MSKKFQGKPCIYCGKNLSTTGDHVVAREFFHVEDRGNLPKVPACKKCNGDKSALEHYVLAVLPLAGTQSKALDMISEKVWPRLRKNMALSDKIVESMRPVAGSNAPSGPERWMAIRFDSTKLAELCAYIAQGLAWHHWKLQLSPDAVVRANVTAPRITANRDLVWSNPELYQHVKGGWGDGVFAYTGARSSDSPLSTLWEMSFFGGVALSDSSGQNESARSLMAFSLPAKDWPRVALERGTHIHCGT